MGISSAQLRAARALLRWSALDLAKASKVGVATVATKLKCPGLRKVEMSLGSLAGSMSRRSTSEAAKAEAVRTGDVFAKRTQSIELFRSLPSARNRKARKLPPASRSLSPLASVSALMDLDKKDAKSSELTIFSGFHCRHNPGCRSPAFAGAVRPAASHPLVHGRLNVCLKIVGMPASRVSACFEHCGPATATLRRKKAPAANLPP